MGIVAIIPVAQMAAANAALEPSPGPLNFSVPAFGNGNRRMAACMIGARSPRSWPPSRHRPG